MPLPTSSLFPPPSWHSLLAMSGGGRRSVVHSIDGMVACTQPLAAKSGIEILRAGGNAADAAVAIAAGLNMTEPYSTGLGGDMFCLYYDAATRKVSALNGSGRSGRNCTLEKVRASLQVDGIDGSIPQHSVHAVTVPGAAAGWCDTVERFGSGKLSMAEILAPAIELGERGFPLSELTAVEWAHEETLLRKASPNFAELLKADPAAPDGFRSPRAGEIVKNKNLAQTFRMLAQHGKRGFYAGHIADEIINVCHDRGGFLEREDLLHHLEQGSEPVEPVSLRMSGATCSSDNDHTTGKQTEAGIDVWEHPPNGQGIVALIALGVLRELERQGTIPRLGPKDYNTAPYLHAIIEALRIGFADASRYVADPNVSDVPTAALLSDRYLASRCDLFSADQASDCFQHGAPRQLAALQSSDTVYFAVADAMGNAISFINSIYSHFGTGIVPKGCGFALQSRGANFSLDNDHPNVLAPRKRPYHTIIPGLVTNAADGSLHSVFGVMGGFMQPQGHVQVLLGQVIGGLSVQQALDAPRICLGSGRPTEGGGDGLLVYVEDGMPEETIQGLRERGHKIKVVRGVERMMFGRGQIIRYTVDEVDKTTGVWSAGSDMRGDGAAYPA